MKRALCIAMMFVAAVAFTQAQETFQSQDSNRNQAQLQGCCKNKKCKCTCTGDILNCACQCATCAGKGCSTPIVVTPAKTKKSRSR